MFRLFMIIFTIVLFVSCGSFNDAKGELHYYNTISHGKQLVDLKEALDKNIISKQEYDTLRQWILHNVVEIPDYIKDINE